MTPSADPPYGGSSLPGNISVRGRRSRARRIFRWVAFLAILAAVLYSVGFFAYGFVSGAPEYIAGTPKATDCQTPGSKFGWTYEAVNYDIADDATLLAANPKPTDCVTQGATAGSKVVSPDGIHLAAWYIPRSGDFTSASGTEPTIVLVHGGKSNASGMLDYAKPLHGAYNVLIVDLRNSGRSGDAASTGGLREQTDLRAMLDWLVTTKGPSWIAVLGNSNGAATAPRPEIPSRTSPAVSADPASSRSTSSGTRMNSA